MVQAFEDNRPRHLRAASSGPEYLRTTSRRRNPSSVRCSCRVTPPRPPVEICSPDDFYKPAHGHIFAAIAALFARGEPVDAVTVTDELNRSGLMEVVGDPGVLLSLQISTRRLRTPALRPHRRGARAICAGSSAWPARSPRSATASRGRGRSGGRGRAPGLRRGERRTADTLVPLKDLLGPSLDRIEEIAAHSGTVTGVADPATTTSTTSSPGCRRRA